ncbi:transcription termination/antitermination NusG family protein, partial [Phocaeicola dorei]
MNSLTCNAKHWFALKVFYNKVFEMEESLEKEQIKSYIPCEEVLIVRNGIKKTIRKPVINSLMFFQSTILEAVNVQERFKDKVILYTRNKDGRKRPLAIPEREMNIFMLVSSSGEQGMEYFG